MKTKNEKTSTMNLFGVILISLLMVSPVAFADNSTNSTNSTSGGSSGGSSGVAVPPISIVDAGEYYLKFNSFSTNSQLSFAAGLPGYRYIAQLQGYNPQLPAEISLGSLAAGTQVTFQHSTVFEGKNYGPFYSTDPANYKIENLGSNRWRFTVDDGLHMGDAYNDAQFEIYKKDAGTPDLSVDSINITTYGYGSYGGITNTYAMVKNIGNANSQSFSLDWYLDGSFLFTTGGNGLAPGASAKSSAYSSAYPAGAHTLKFVVRPSGADANSGNNEMSQDFTIPSTAPSDLKVGDLGITPGSYDSSGAQSVGFSATIENGGPQTSGVYMANIYLDGSLVCSSYTQPALGPGQKYQLSGCTKSVSPGSHTASVSITLYGDVGDSDATNNKMSKPFTVATQANKAPTISGITPPPSLTVGETGTWKIIASDPEGGALSYSVVWGDENYYKTMGKTIASSPQQTATFTHIYYNSGTYYPAITVTDDQGATAQTSASVYVGTEPQPTCQTIPNCLKGYTPQFSGYDSSNCAIYTCVPTVNPAPILTSNMNGPSTIAANQQGSWSVNAYDPAGGKIKYSVAWGDGNKDVQTYPSGPQSLASFPHTYASAGYYQIKATMYNDAGLTTISSTSVNVNSAGTADLAVDSIDVKVDSSDYQDAYGSPRGYRTNIIGVIKNIGTASSGSYIMTGYLDGGNTVFGNNYHPSLSAGESTSIDFFGYPAYLKAGWHTAKFVIKPNGYDANADNNYMSKDFYVQNPDTTQVYVGLKVNGADSPSSVNYKDTATLSWNSNGEYCYAFLSYVLLPDGRILSDIRLPPSGSMTILAATKNDAYTTEIPIGIYCNKGSESAKDSLTLPISKKDENKAPTISVSPESSSLIVGETGTWSVKASDPEGGALSYHVVWGDYRGKEAPEDSYATMSNGQTATFTHVYYSARTYTPTFTVTDDKGSTAETSATANVQLKVSPPGTQKIDIEMSAEPSSVNLYDTFKVNGKITWLSTASPSASKKFKVVTSFYSPVSSTAASQKKLAASVRRVSLASQDNSDLLAIIQQYFANKELANAKESAAAQNAASAPTASTTSVVDVSINSENSAGQSRVDYISLAPGESETVSAYFVAGASGARTVTMQVYEADGNSGNYRLVAQSSTQVIVSGSSQPPAPPSEGTIELYKGWNMVSVPAMASVSMSEVSQQCGSKPYAWRLASTGYVKEYTLLPGVGYWIYSNSACSFDVAENNDTVSSSSALGLFAGWNLIATASDVSMSDFTGDCKVSSGPLYYSHATSTPSYIYSSSLEPGKSYWVKVNSACTLSTVDISAPPAPPA